MAKEADQTVRRGWGGEFGQMYRRCPAFYEAAAQFVFSDVQATYPLTARYMDVHPALGTEECFDPNHPKSRNQWKQNNFDLFNFIKAWWGLVLSGEHGKGWFVPVMDVFNGVMSSPGWPWYGRPSYYGQLQYGDNPALPSDAWFKYETYGSLGHAYRVPLFELVYHDCAVATWYPFDATDWTVAMTGGGEWYQTKKDALNVLYGTPAILFNSGPDGSWHLNRPAFMNSYRNTCKTHEALADKEMVNHEFLTADRSVQKTTWSDGTVVVANFGMSDYLTWVGSHYLWLKQYDFGAAGPNIVRASRSWDIAANRSVVHIEMDGYYHNDYGVPVTLRRINPHLVRVNTDTPVPSVWINPSKVVSTWNYRNTRIYALDRYGARVGTVPFTYDGGVGFTLTSFAGMGEIVDNETSP